MHGVWYSWRHHCRAALLWRTCLWVSSGFQEDLVYSFWKLLLFLAYLSISASVLTLAIMTIDRYFAIVRPMRRPLSVCPPRWIENIHDSHNITMFEMVIRFVLLYLVSLLPMAMFYSEIALHLWKRKAPGLHIDKNQKRIEKQKRWSQFLSP